MRPESCRAATGKRNTPKKIATRISQKVQRQRRRTPIESQHEKTRQRDHEGNLQTAAIARGQLQGLVVNLWSHNQDHDDAKPGEQEEANTNA